MANFFSLRQHHHHHHHRHHQFQQQDFVVFDSFVISFEELEFLHDCRHQHRHRLRFDHHHHFSKTSQHLRLSLERHHVVAVAFDYYYYLFESSAKNADSTAACFHVRFSNVCTFSKIPVLAFCTAPKKPWERRVQVARRKQNQPSR